jgi:phospholipid/cholesterol/gamma-HCH transport system substrate-binding protein
MGNSRVLEIVVGMFVALGIAALFMLAMKVSNLSSFGADDGYALNARFENIGGLKVMSPVSVGGVRIGRVMAIDFDQQRYEAVVKMLIDPAYNRLPKDTSASIFTAGLLGEQYVNLEPGAEESYLKDGDDIHLTQSSLVMEQVIGQFLFGKASESGGQ